MTKVERSFFTLLEAGLWGTTPKIPVLTNEEWQEIYYISEKQAVMGVIADAIELLSAEKRMARVTLLKFIGIRSKIIARNNQLNSYVEEIVSRYRKEGIEPVLLKGQGVAQYYRNPSSRNSGDIDLFFGPEHYKAANDLMEKWGGIEHESTGYHTGFTYKDCEVENHVKFVDFSNKRNKKALSEFLNKVPLICNEKVFLNDAFFVEVPTPQMNSIYLFLHMQHHLFQLGIGLRQVCDWCCLLKYKKNEIDVELFKESIDLLHIRRSVTALTWICEKYLGLEKDLVPVYTTTRQAQKDGELLLLDIMQGGNFGRDNGVMGAFEKHAGLLHNLNSYFKAFSRQVRLMRLCPKEVLSYQKQWLLNKYKTIDF